MTRTIVTTAEQDAVLEYAAAKFGLADGDAYIAEFLRKNLNERGGHKLQDENEDHLSRFSRLPPGRQVAIRAELNAVDRP